MRRTIRLKYSSVPSAMATQAGFGATSSVKVAVMKEPNTEGSGINTDSEDGST